MKTAYTEPILEVKMQETRDVIRTSETELPPDEFTFAS